MSVLVVGVSHRTAPVALLEQVTVGLHDTRRVVTELRAGVVHEAIVLATCNRVEVYADTDGFHAGFAAVSDLLARGSGVPLRELSEHLYVHYEGAAVLHLFEVACGLDSMVIGESQILGQLRKAYAASTGGAGRTLHELFQNALRVGKRAHTETGIDRAGRSLVTVGLDTAGGAIGPLPELDALVIGAGSMSALAGATLRRESVRSITVANRTAANAERLAGSLSGTGIGLDELESALVRADLVVSSTGSTGQVLDVETVRRALAARHGRPIAFVDLALPRDIDPAVRELPGVTLVDLTSLQQALSSTEAGADLAAVHALVAEEVRTFLAWQRTSGVGPTVAALRGRADQVVAAELGRLRNRLPDLDDRSRAEVAVAVRRVVDKLLHSPTVRVRELAEAPAASSYAEALRELFELDPTAPAAVAATSLEPGPLDARELSA